MASVWPWLGASNRGDVASMNEDDDNWYFAAGIVIVMVLVAAIIGAIGPIISDWIL